MPSVRVVAIAGSPRRPPAAPTVLERAERLRDEVLKSKLCHPDPWNYTPKARAWGERAQRIVDIIASGEDADAHRRELEAFAAEVEGDPDFQEARRLF
jgi:hypothetical protein